MACLFTHIGIAFAEQNYIHYFHSPVTKALTNSLERIMVDLGTIQVIRSIVVGKVCMWWAAPAVGSEQSGLLTYLSS